jgi:hypothetical protein
MFQIVDHPYTPGFAIIFCDICGQARHLHATQLVYDEPESPFSLKTHVTPTYVQERLPFNER